MIGGGLDRCRGSRRCRCRRRGSRRSRRRRCPAGRWGRRRPRACPGSGPRRCRCPGAAACRRRRRRLCPRRRRGCRRRRCRCRRSPAARPGRCRAGRPCSGPSPPSRGCRRRRCPEAPPEAPPTSEERPSISRTETPSGSSRRRVAAGGPPTLIRRDRGHRGQSPKMCRDSPRVRAGQENAGEPSSDGPSGRPKREPGARWAPSSKILRWDSSGIPPGCSYLLPGPRRPGRRVAGWRWYGYRRVARLSGATPSAAVAGAAKALVDGIDECSG